MKWVLAILITGFILWGANRMLYYPMKYPAGEWSMQTALGARDIIIQAADGKRLHAWWIQAPGSPRRVTLHLHGNAGNVSHRSLSARNILAAGSSVLLLDYRGYGKSEGAPSERGLYRDGEAAFDWLTAQGHAPEQIVLHGESLGTAVAAYVAERRKCAGLVLEAPFPSARAVAGRVVPLLGPILVWGYETKARMKNIRAPVFVIHGDRDEIIAYEFGQEVFAAANDPKWFWTIPGATHNDLHLVGRDEFARRLAEFYKRVG